MSTVAAQKKLIQYYCPDTDGQQMARFVQPVLALLQAVRLFDPQQFICKHTWIDSDVISSFYLCQLFWPP